MVVALPTPNKHYLLWEKLLIWSQISSEGHLLTYTERNLLLPTDGLQQNGPFGQIFIFYFFACGKEANGIFLF